MIEKGLRDMASSHQSSRPAQIKTLESGKCTVVLPDGRLMAGVGFATEFAWSVDDFVQIEKTGNDWQVISHSMGGAAPPEV